MAFASLFTLLDDITAVLDDVAMMTKVAAKKTAGVVGDDLALNANQVTGVSAERELPIIWAVAKGSLVNKLILVPLALLLSAFLPALITPLLMIGGVYLCFEGVEKLLHKFLHRNEHEDGHNAEPEVTDEKTKVKGAVRTDFILSAEIIIIALGVVEKYDLMTRSLVMAAIGVGMTVLVYGLVGIIVKLDDLGMMLMRQKSAAVQGIGRGLISFMPWFYARLEYCRHAGDVLSRRRTDRPQPWLFARFPPRATLGQRHDGTYRQSGGRSSRRRIGLRNRPTCNEIVSKRLILFPCRLKTFQTASIPFKA